MKARGPKEQQVAALRESREKGERADPVKRAAAVKQLSQTLPAKAPATQETAMTTTTTTTTATKAAKKPAGKRSAKAATSRRKVGKASAKAARTPADGPRDGKKGVRPGSKLSMVVALLTRKEGCTAKEVLEKTQWPAVSMNQQAKSAGLKLRKVKEDGITRYFGE